MYILLTVDTEASMRKNRPLSISKMVYGEIDGKYYGIPKIMRLCEEHGFRATFFVSVLEYLHHGEEAIAGICQQIRERGHDVQLHIHPEWKYGKRYLWRYSLQQQIELIEEGSQKLYQWLGEKPIAHRAGSFGANLDTLRALCACDIPIDSSLFHGYQLSQLGREISLRNEVSVVEGVLELPSTVFTQLKLNGFESYRNLDINADSLMELKYVIKKAKRSGIKVLVLLLHSFSLLSFNSERTQFKPNSSDIKKLKRLLCFIKNDPDVEVVTMKDFYEIYRHNPEQLSNHVDYVPHTGSIRMLLRAFLHFRKGWKNKLVVLATVLVFIALTIVIFHVLQSIL